MKIRATALMMVLAIMPALLLTGVAKAEGNLKPFLLAFESAGDMAAAIADVKGKLSAGGLELVGEHAPYDNTTLLIVTSDTIKAAAAKSDFGGYAAAQRVSLSAVDGKVQVSYTNPTYMAAAYRMTGDNANVTAQLAKALGAGTPFGAAEGLAAEDLREYHYMFGMEYFDEPSVLAEYASQSDAIAAVEKGLASGVSGITKVYRVDVPGKEESVFGVSMDGKKGAGTMQDDTYLMSQIDFGTVKSAAHLPYEILVSGGTVYALYARFRIAINFPDLSMMGSNSFMSIMGCPTAIQKALTLAAGGTPAAE